MMMMMMMMMIFFSQCNQQQWSVRQKCFHSELTADCSLLVSRRKETKARFRRRSTHVPNLTDELSPAKERRLNQFGTAVLVRCGNVVKFDKVCRIIRHWSGN